MFDASIAPSAAPVPTSVCSSSINSKTSPSAEVTSCNKAFNRSSNSPRNLAPATRAPRSRDRSRLSIRLSGTSPFTMRSARPSAIAVLPTPGSPIRTGLFLVRRESTWTVRRISSSRPITGSSLPMRAASVKSCVYFLRASYPSSAVALSALRPLRISLIAVFTSCAEMPASARIFATLVSWSRASASNSDSTVTKLSPAFFATCSAWSKNRAVSGAR